MARSGDHLAALRDDDVVRRQHGERATAGALRGDEDAAGLRDEGIAAGDGGVALLEIGYGVAGLGEDSGQAELFGEALREGNAMSGDALPLIFNRERGELAGGVLSGGDVAKICFQARGILREEGDLFLEARPDGWQPFAEGVRSWRRGIGNGMRRDVVLDVAGDAMRRGFC